MYRSSGWGLFCWSAAAAVHRHGCLLMSLVRPSNQAASWGAGSWRNSTWTRLESVFQPTPHRTRDIVQPIWPREGSPGCRRRLGSGQRRAERDGPELLSTSSSIAGRSRELISSVCPRCGAQRRSTEHPHMPRRRWNWATGPGLILLAFLTLLPCNRIQAIPPSRPALAAKGAQQQELN